MSLALAAAITIAASQTLASEVTFTPFAGSWEGDGTIRFGDGAKERMRCTADYEVTKSSGREVYLGFNCKSDKYSFLLDGRVEADQGGSLSGQWTETSRNVGGTAIGKLDGKRVRVRIESSGFGANLLITLQDNRQKVSIKSGGAGEEAEAQIALRKKK